MQLDAIDFVKLIFFRTCHFHPAAVGASTDVMPFGDDPARLVEVNEQALVEKSSDQCSFGLCSATIGGGRPFVTKRGINV
jgi:hypothetical protein